MGGGLNYYSHHIGDYLSATAHLTLLEHGAYRRLIDVYYIHEAALPVDSKQVYRLVGARTKEEKEAVDVVLGEFFKKTPEGWRQDRCEHEIGLCDKNRTNGKKGGRPSKKDNPPTNQTANPSETQTKPKHNPEAKPPITPSPHHPITQDSGTDVPGEKQPMKPDEIIFGYGVPLLTAAGSSDKQARSFLGGLRKAHGDAALIDKLRACIRAKPLQPLEWMAAALPPGGVNGHSKQTQLESRNAAVIAAWVPPEMRQEEAA